VNATTEQTRPTPKKLADLELTPQASEVLAWAAQAKKELDAIDRVGSSRETRSRITGAYSAYVRVFSLLTDIRSYMNIHQIVAEAAKLESGTL
jgi:hypothetical protein